MNRFTLNISTDGSTDIVNLSQDLAKQIRDYHGDGLVHLFAVGSTCALTTIEFEPGLVKSDFRTLMQKLIPDDARYEHEMTWNDDNGHSHLRASLIGAEVTIPYSKGKLLMGDYQQVVLIDFDTRPRKRTIIGTVMT